VFRARASSRGVHNSKQISTLEDAMLEYTGLDDTTSENTIFADSMLETPWAQRARRSWTTMTSFGLQAVIIGLLLMLPVLQTVGLPAARTVSTPISLGRRSPDPIAGTPRTGTPHAAQNNSASPRFVAPGRIPRIISTSADDATPQTTAEHCNAICDPISSTVGTASGPGFPFSLGGNRPVLPTPPPTITRAIRTSSMLEGNLLHRVEPVYPPLAKTARIQGSVVLVAVISKAGTIDNLHAVSGPPMLVPAAVAAVSQWRYRPYILNSEPIEVETQITVNFLLSGN
jgi:periplasmic protein TonB